MNVDFGNKVSIVCVFISFFCLMFIIGLTWTLGSWKGTIVDYLVSHHHFHQFSASTFITQEVLKRGLPLDRDSLRVVADSLREAHGSAYIVEQLYARAIKSGQNAIIESIRTVGEVQFLKQKPNTSLWSVEANPRIRYQRISDRGSDIDSVSFEYFLQQEANESNNTNPSEMDLPSCISMADYHITNNGTIEELQQQVDAIMDRLHIPSL